MLYLRKALPLFKKCIARQCSIALSLFCMLVHAPASVAIDIGDVAKDFAVRNADGSIVTLGSLMEKTDVVLLEFFSVYCHTCREYVPFVNRIAKDYTDRRVTVLGVAIENNQQEVQEFINQFGVRYPAFADPDKTTYYLYGIQKVPTVFLIDNLWIVRYRGALEKDSSFEEKITGLLTAGDGLLKDGDIIPDFTLPDRSGKELNLGVLSKNKKTVLGFFTGNTAAAESLAQVLNRINTEYQHGDITVLGIIARDFRETTDSFMQRCSVNFPVLMDTDGTVAKNYRLGNTAEVFVINEEGRIRKRGPHLSYEQLTESLGKEPGTALAELSAEDTAQFLKRVMPGAASFDSVQINGETIHVGTAPDGTKQYARFVKKDILCDVCANVYFVYALDDAGIIRAIVMIESLEHYGKHIEGREFLEQFIGKSYHEPFVLGKNVDGITGATKSTLLIIEGLNETEAVFKTFVSDPDFDVSFRKKVCFKHQLEIESALRIYNREHPQVMETLNMHALAPYFSGGAVPQCPANGVYKLIPFNNVLHVLCTVHGLDPSLTTVY